MQLQSHSSQRQDLPSRYHRRLKIRYRRNQYTLNFSMAQSIALAFSQLTLALIPPLSSASGNPSTLVFRFQRELSKGHAAITDLRHHAWREQS